MRPPGYIQLGGEVGCTLPQSIHPGMHGVRLQLRRPRCDVGTSATVHSRRGEGAWLRSVRRAARDRNAHPILAKSRRHAAPLGSPGGLSLVSPGFTEPRSASSQGEGTVALVPHRSEALRPRTHYLPPYPQGVD